MANKFKIIAFDVDGTLVDDTVFVWDSIHDAYGVGKAARRQAMEQYFAGKLDYRGWFFEDIRLLQEAGATREGLMKVISGMKLMDGAQETLAALHATGAHLVIISGTLDLVVKHFGLDGLVHEVFCNRFHFDDAGRLSGGTPTPFDIEAKAEALKVTAKRLGVPLAETAFVGDNFNDVEIAKAAGLSLAFNCKSDALAKVATHVVPGQNLRHVLKYLM
jgi:phosphoserine phosphatase